MYAFVCVGMGRPLPRVPAEGSYGGDHLSVSRTLCGALIFPSIANLVGRLLFRRVTSNLQRTILVSPGIILLHQQGKCMKPNGGYLFQGGIAFVVIKGVLKVYFKQQQYLIQANRHILNYPEPEGRADGTVENSNDDSGNE